MTATHRRSAGLALVAAIAAFVGTTAAPRPPAARTSRPRTRCYHTYPEMVDEIQAVEAAHPDIVDVFSIGESVHGRDIWAAKVSDNVATDEDEPEVLFDAAHHADEHLTVEQALYLFHALVDDYGVGPKVTRLVDTREIWIIFMLNPDGVQFDLTRRSLPGLAEEPPAEPDELEGRDRPQPELRLQVGLLRRLIGQARRRRRIAAGSRSRRRRRGRSPTSSRAG